jgi:glycosyltransferase involved in cell wall biosynthesis
MSITAVILAKNEELNIEHAIRSVTFCDEILVIDDESSDRTGEIASSFNTTVITRPLKGDFAAARALGESRAASDWILHLDADEIVPPELAPEIQKVATRRSDIAAYYIKRHDFFWGREMRWGETRTARTQGFLRLMQKGSGHWEGAVHETFVTTGQTDTLQGHINHVPHPTVASFLRSINLYSDLRAKQLFTKGKRFNGVELIALPSLKFFYTYILKFGFLDGAPGFIYSFAMSFHSFLVRAKLYHFREEKSL